MFDDDIGEDELDDFTGLDDIAVDEYVLRAAFLEGLPAGMTLTVGDIVVPLNDVEQAMLREWLNDVVVRHPEAF